LQGAVILPPKPPPVRVEPSKHVGDAKTAAYTGTDSMKKCPTSYLKLRCTYTCTRHTPISTAVCKIQEQNSLRELGGSKCFERRRSRPVSKIPPYRPRGDRDAEENKTPPGPCPRRKLRSKPIGAFAQSKSRFPMKARTGFKSTHR